MEHEREGSNGSVDGETLDKYLGRIDKADDKLVKLKIEHMQACKGPRGTIRDIMKEARESGINMPALRTILAKHRAERKIDRRIDELEADDRADYDSMLQALGAFGDTPLGDAALKKARPRDDDNISKLDDLRQ